MLLVLKDGGIVDIWTDEEYDPGCPTCDYGSHYINNLKITLTKHIITASVDQMYEYRFSSGDMMKIILPNIDMIQHMTEDEFIEWFKQMFTRPKEFEQQGIRFTFDVSENN